MNKIISNPFILGLRARNLTVAIHRHSAYQLVLSNNVPFTSTINGRVHKDIYGFLIKPQVSHLCAADEGTLSVLNNAILSAKEKGLTDIAYDTGFYDLPQFNKYMHAMFGMPPIALKQNSDLIQVH